MKKLLFNFVPKLNVMKTLLLKPISISCFFVAFCILYNPFGIQQFFSGLKMGYFVNILILGCIVLVVTSGTRAVLDVLSAHYEIKRWQRMAWVLGEMVLDAAFMALYIALIKKITYYEALTAATKYSIFCLVFPYVFFALAWKTEPEKEEKSLVKFYDEHKRLKLSITQNSLLFIQAETNYIKVFYLESGKTKDFLIRNSMKSQEENIRDFGLVRCHRSYIVNPRHVTLLRKEKDGPINAVLDSNTTLTVPVSKQYYDSLSSLL